MEKLELKFKLTEKELKAFYRRNAIKTFFSKDIAVLMICIVLIVTGYLAILGIRDISAYIDTYKTFAAYALFIGIFSSMGNRKHVEKLIKTNHYFTKEYIRIFSHEGIRYEYGDGEVLLEWQDFHSFSQNKHFYFIMHNEIEVLPIPKSALKTDKEKEFFIGCIKNIEQNEGKDE